jgi:hypothetical protein
VARDIGVDVWRCIESVFQRIFVRRSARLGSGVVCFGAFAAAGTFPISHDGSSADRRASSASRGRNRPIRPSRSMIWQRADLLPDCFELACVRDEPKKASQQSLQPELVVRPQRP